jgi:SAM-dependent methyltransferase
VFREKDRQKCDQLFDRYYKGRKFSRALYSDLVRKYARSGHRLLDAGCGRHLEFSRDLTDLQVCGVDVLPTLATRNERSPFGICSDLGCLPFPSNSFDLVISRSVVEHLNDPRSVFREFHRVLKPGGKVILSTPNKYDYVSIIAMMLPYRLHQIIVSKVLRCSEDDVFPTLYRANTLSKLDKELRTAGFEKKELAGVNHYPVYLTFSPILFRLGIVYERLTSMRWGECLRGTLLCVFEKPAAAAATVADGVDQKEDDSRTLLAGA